MFWNYKALDTHYKYFHICYKAYLCLICGRHFAQRNGKGHLINHAIVEHKLEKIEQLASIEQLDVKEIHQMDQRIEKESFVMRNEIKVEENISSDEELKSESMKKKRVQQTLYGDDVDTVEKLFDSEIAGTSIYAGKLHLNVSMCNVLSNGELTNDGLEEMDVLRWKDLLCCSKCKFNCVSIIKLKKHIAQNHARSFHALVCGECDDCSYHNETPWLNHVVSKHYEHLKLW